MAADKLRYDLAFGLGGACCCTQALRNAGLQHASFPWDWVAESDIRTRADQVRDDLAGWLPDDALQRIETPSYKAGVVYRNERTKIVFAHDFPPKGSFAEDYPKVVERYRRRYEHLTRLISGARRVLVVWIDVPACPRASEDDCRYVLDLLSGKWPTAEFDLLTFSQEDGRRASDFRETRGPSVRRVYFDYRDPRETGWVADNRLLGKWLLSHYRVPDYRSAEERRNWRKAVKAKEYGRYRASNAWGYVVTKIQYKIYNHFMKRLTQKGVI